MAVLTLYHALRETELVEGELTLATRTQIQVVAGPITTNFYGRFDYDNAGDLEGGIATGSDQWDSGNGGLQYSITGLQADVIEAFWYVYMGDELGFAQYIFGGNDTVFGSPEDDVIAGYTGTDLLIGAGGNDMLAATTDNQPDRLEGGPGDDIYVVGGYQFFMGIGWTGTADVVVEGAGEGTDQVISQGGFGLPDHVENLLLGGMGPAYATGNALPNRLVGNDSDNLIEGRGGNDSLQGMGGLDTLRGGAGDDLYQLQGPQAVLQENPGEGTDTVSAPFSWQLGPDFEILELVGAGAIDGTGNALANRITGNAMDNRLDGGDGADTLDGGAGNDTYVIDSADDQLIDSAGTDTVESFLEQVRLAAGYEHLLLLPGVASGEGNAAANRITGNSKANLLTGGEGNDTLDGAGGLDTMVGGRGDDSYEVNRPGDTVTELAGEGFDTVLSSVSLVLGEQLEALVLTGSEFLHATGNALDNRITGNAGFNRIDGGAGNDTMDGGWGGDTYLIDSTGDVVADSGEGGEDLLITPFSTDLALFAGIENVELTGSADLWARGNALTNNLGGNAGRNLLTAVGADFLRGFGGNDTLVGSDDADWLDGGSGNDSMSGGAGNDIYLVDAAGDQVLEAAGGGFDTLYAAVSIVLPAHVEWVTLAGAGDLNASGTAAGGEVLIGNAWANVLHTGGGQGDGVDAGAGDDSLYDDGGSAQLFGGMGDDSYYVSGNDDTLTESAGWGVDTVHASGSYSLGEGFERLVLVAGTDGTGNGEANRITGNALANVLDGGAGADTLEGGLGDDLYLVDSAQDQVIELAGQGNDTVQAAGHSYSLAGTAVETLLLGDASAADADATGNELANQLRGTLGRNRIDGGAGADQMTGLAGDDSYVVDHAGDSPVEAAGGGTDTVYSRLAAYTLGAQVERLVLQAGAVAGTGNALDNSVMGNAAANTLVGAGGNDTIDGDAGSDVAVYAGTRAAYTVSQGAGQVTVQGAEGTDLLVGVDVLRFADQDLTLNAHLASGTVTLLGAVIETSSLTAQAASLADADGVGALAWQWFRDGDAITGATGSSYQLVAADVGASMQARLRFVDGGGHTETLWSAASAAVAGWDRSAPVMLDSVPANGSIEVPLEGNLVLHYSEPVLPGSGWVVLRHGGEVVESFDVASSARIVFAGDTVTFDPIAPLVAGRFYTLVLQPAAIVDATGNQHVDRFGSAGVTVDFIAAAAPDVTGPVPHMLLPYMATLDATLDLSVQLAFGEQPFAAQGTVLLRMDSGEVVKSFDVAASADLVLNEYQMALHLGDDLPAGHGFVVEIPAGALVDGLGNPGAFSGDLGFRTEAAVVDGTVGADALGGAVAWESIFGYRGNDTLQGGGGNDTFSGGDGIDTVLYGGNRADYLLEPFGSAATVTDNAGRGEGVDRVGDAEFLRFADRNVDLGMAAKARSIAQADLKTLEEFYVGYFNRVPEAQGLGYWIDELRAGVSLVAIADRFYDAGVQFGVYSAGMSNQQFIQAVYANVLYRPPGSPTAPTAQEIAYWNDRLVAGQDSKGSMVLTMLHDVHAYFENDPDYGFVAASLNNKAAVADYYAVQQGLSLNVQADNIGFGIALAQLITPTDTAAAIAFIGVNDFSMPWY